MWVVPNPEMDTEDFMEHGLDSEGDSESIGGESEEEAAPQEAQTTKKKISGQKHKKSLEKMKEYDPEFYEFLKSEDKDLLNFEESDDSDEDDDDDDGKGKKHKPPKKLEVASDDSSDEDEEEPPEPTEGDKKKKRRTKGIKPLTLKMISHWSQQLRSGKSLNVLHEVVSAFRCAVQQAGSDEPDPESKYAVEGSAVFNAIVRLCLTDILPMLIRTLKLPKSKDPKSPTLPSTSKKWKSVRTSVKNYLNDLLQLTGTMKEPGILNVLLKHVNQLIVYYSCFPKLARLLLKRMIVIWGSGDETSRVLAFLSINKMTLLKQNSLLEFVLKQMYMSYVKNCKFTSPNTLPLINFMQRSLVEMYAIDVTVTYQYAFVYIRQLAIHLRNAIKVKKQESCQAVYNWQYVHSLALWCRLLSMLHPDPITHPLIYPLTQTIIGTIKLIPTARYFPLRFHCIRSLNLLAQSTGTFIPTLPLVLEVFHMTDFNKKHKSLGFKPFNFACILKFSKTQLSEKGFRDGLVDQLYEHLLECLHVYSHSISFPELALPAALQIKSFLKKCKVANYTRQMKQLLDKVQETCKVITLRRRSATLNLADRKSVAAWEKRSVEEGTPVGQYYANWRKLRDRELQHEIAGKDRISTDNLPTIDRPRGPRVATEDERKEFADLFDSDNEDSDDDERFLLKDERAKKKKKTDDEDESDDSQEYSDFDDDELEQLAQSASEDDDDEEESDVEDEDEDEEVNEEEDDEDDGENGDDSDQEDSDIPEGDDVVEDFKMSDLESD